MLPGFQIFLKRYASKKVKKIQSFAHLVRLTFWSAEKLLSASNIGSYRSECVDQTCLQYNPSMNYYLLNMSYVIFYNFKL